MYMSYYQAHGNYSHNSSFASVLRYFRTQMVTYYLYAHTTPVAPKKGRAQVPCPDTKPKQREQFLN